MDGKSAFKPVDKDGNVLGSAASPLYVASVGAGQISLVTPASGSKAASADWFGTDVTIPATGVILITFKLESNAVVEITLDGAAYGTGKDGATILANTWQYWEIPVIAGDLFNIRQTTGTITLTTCRVQQ